MRLRLALPTLGLALGLLLASGTMSQIAAQATATGTCKDGTTTSSKTKSGACRGHGGVATWTGPTTTSKSGGAAAPSTAAASTSAGAAITCADGTTSTSKSRKGACRGHGGIAKEGAAASKATAPAPAPAPAPAAAPAAAPAPKPAAGGAAPAGATAQCKDGTYSSSKHHEGACSHHGGVAQWLDGTKNP